MNSLCSISIVNLQQVSLATLEDSCAMLNEYGGFLCYLLRCSQITLPPFLLFERGLTDKFPKPSFGFLNNSMGILPKIEITPFWRNFCWLRSEVIRRHLLWRAITWKDKETPLFLFKRNLHFLGVPLLIHGWSICPFLRQPGGPWCNVSSWKFRVKAKLYTLLSREIIPKKLALLSADFGIRNAEFKKLEKKDLFKRKRQSAKCITRSAIELLADWVTG
jgi:hypothetical protein